MIQFFKLTLSKHMYYPVSEEWCIIAINSALSPQINYSELQHNLDLRP